MDAQSRSQQRQRFLEGQLEREDFAVETASADASFRSYYRIRCAGHHWILMDAPPDREDCRPFLDVADRLRAANLHAPQVHGQDLSSGFLLLEDLGDVHYRERITTDATEPWFERAFNVLLTMAASVDATGLPHYDRARLTDELDLFPDWYLDRQLGQPLEDGERESWSALCRTLIDCAQAQPQVFVHRDFHSCNLMDTGHEQPGIIDFQDAVRGPLSYDLVSFLLDRYITWPRQRIESWMEAFRQRAGVSVTGEEWRLACDWMGLQRNLKVVGIFARLNFRDGKAHYLDLQPRFLEYVLDVIGRYPEFSAMRRILEARQCAP